MSLKSSPAFLNLVRNPQPINFFKKRVNVESEIETQSPESWKTRMEKIQSMRDWLIKNLDDAFAKQSKYYNLRCRQLRFLERDLVLSRNRDLSSRIKNISAKLCPRYAGPYRVSKVLSPTVELCDLTHKFVGKSHIEDLKPFILPNEDPLSNPQVT